MIVRSFHYLIEGCVLTSLLSSFQKYVLVEFSTIQDANSLLIDAKLEYGSLFPAEGRVLELRETNSEFPAETSKITWNKLGPNKNFLFPEMKTCESVIIFDSTHLY